MREAPSVHGPSARLLAPAAVALALLAAAGGAEASDHTCSAPGQPPCCVLFVCTDCDYVLLPLLGQCSDSDGFPTFCGGENERPARRSRRMRNHPIPGPPLS